MKSFGVYISKHLLSFLAFILVLVLLNGVAFGLTFHHIFIRDFGETSPRKLLEVVAAASDLSGISEDEAQTLRDHHIWAMYLNESGEVAWSLDLPQEIPEQFTIGEVAVFSKGYLADYPVFVWDAKDGLLVLGYPKDSYTKLTSNYYPLQAIQRLPLYVAGMMAVDLLLLFLAYHFSKRKILKSTGPIISAMEGLADGKPTSLSVPGELSEVASSVNRASLLLSRQNEARANWISGVSHDIRTPLSMIMGYAQRIASNESATQPIREQAKIIGAQSVKIKELVQDLNLVSQLEYEMQPLHKEPVRLSKLVRSYGADLLNTGLPDAYSLDIEVAWAAETAVLECDARLVSRAVGNLVQNSIQHNPQGCEVKISLDCSDTAIRLVVADDGIGLSEKELQELNDHPHYMESTDERLDLRHGLGLLLVRQIVTAHGGTVEIESEPQQGCKTVLIFPIARL
jgi:signal transduction histidine kinase